MVKHSLCLHQNTLFMKTREEFLKEIGVVSDELKQWKQLGLLSFDIDEITEFDEKEIIEASFIKALVKNSGISFDRILFMLSKLEKPYCYDLRDIFWDFRKNEWHSIENLLENKIQEYIENNFEELFNEYFDNYLENLKEEGDHDRLNELLKKIQFYQINNDDQFPWEHVIACRNIKKSPNTGETEKEFRKRFQGQINPCPKCGKSFDKMEVFYFESPPKTWEMLCGRAGWIVICIDCKKQIRFELEVMN